MVGVSEGRIGDSHRRDRDRDQEDAFLGVALEQGAEWAGRRGEERAFGHAGVHSRNNAAIQVKPGELLMPRPFTDAIAETFSAKSELSHLVHKDQEERQERGERYYKHVEHTLTSHKR